MSEQTRHDKPEASGRVPARRRRTLLAAAVAAVGIAFVGAGVGFVGFLSQLRGVLSRVARPPDLSAEVKDLRSELRSLGHFGRLVGGSPPMQRLYDQLSRVAPTGATVFITGESGTGKEIVAQTIHEVSRRRCGRSSP